MKITKSMRFNSNDELSLFTNRFNQFINRMYLNDNPLNQTKDELEERFFTSFSLKCWDWENHCEIPLGVDRHKKRESDKVIKLI